MANAKKKPADGIQMIPLGALFSSPLNARKAPYKTIDDLVASIAAQGLLQNLTVIPGEEGKDVFEVVAGGRRLQALLALQKKGIITGGYLVPCQIKDRADATAISTAENTAREAMHPADEFEAFQKMAEAGQPLEDIAAAFGVAKRVVQQRLELAKVSPRLVAAYRAGEMTLEQLMAFTLSRHHSQQEKYWKETKGTWRARPDQIRQALTEKKISSRSRLAAFVGVDAYKEAGGKFEEDFFSDIVYLLDGKLLAQLVDVKLKKLADAVALEGWAWVETRTEELGWSERNKFSEASTRRIKLTPEQQEAIKELEAELEEVRAKQRAAYNNNDDDDDNDNEYEEIGTKAHMLAGRIKEIKNSVLRPSKAEAPFAGAIVHIDNDGYYEVLRGLVKPEDAKKIRALRKKKETAKSGDDEDAGAGSSSAGDTDKTESYHSGKLIQNLSSHRTLAMRVELAEDPHVALAALVTQLAVDVFNGYWDGRKLLCISDSNPDAQLILSESPASDKLDQMRDYWLAQLPESDLGHKEIDQGKMLSWALEQSHDCLLGLLAFCVAQSFNAVTVTDNSRYPANQVQGELARALELDMTKYWEPTAENYWSHVPKPVLVAAVDEMVGEDSAKKVQAAKKGDAIEITDGLIADAAKGPNGRKWLPGCFQLPAPAGGEE